MRDNIKKTALVAVGAIALWRYMHPDHDHSDRPTNPSFNEKLVMARDVMRGCDVTMLYITRVSITEMRDAVAAEQQRQEARHMN